MPHIEILGVYRLTVTDDLIRRQDAVLSGLEENDPNHVVFGDETEQQLRSVALVELRVVDRDHRFDMGDFTQEQSGKPRESWQAAWAEAYLTDDGCALAQSRDSCKVPEGDLRVAFFIHEWNADMPLVTSYGQLTCPYPISMPKRLSALVPFVTVD